MVPRPELVVGSGKESFRLGLVPCTLLRFLDLKADVLCLCPVGWVSLFYCEQIM